MYCSIYISWRRLVFRCAVRFLSNWLVVERGGYQSHQRAVINTLFMYARCTVLGCMAVYITIMIQKPVKDENHFSLLRSIPQG